MKKMFVGLFLILLLLPTIGLSDANITTNIYSEGDINSKTNIMNAGNTNVTINGVKWNDYNPNYIAENEGTWARDKGMEEDDIEELLDKLERLTKGEDVDVTKDEYDILMSLLYFSEYGADNYYQSNVDPTLDSYRKQIQSNIYDIQAFYKTMEKLHPEIYCESKREVMKENQLDGMKCGLNSKYCYNGRYHAQEEGGFDFCIYSDDEGKTKKGMDIHVTDMKISDSEGDSLTPIKISFYNQGEETMKPTIETKIMRREKVLEEFSQEINEIPTKESKTVIVGWKNGNVEPGKYMARITVSLGKKEILNDIYFNVLEDGSLPMNGEIASVDTTEPRNNEDLEINTMVKNNDNFARAFTLEGTVYRNGEKVDEIESEERLVDSGDTESIPMSYGLEGLENYKVEVNLGDQTETVEFTPEPTTPTGRFITSPSPVKAAVSGLVIIFFAVLVRLRYFKKKSK